MRVGGFAARALFFGLMAATTAGLCGLKAAALGGWGWAQGVAFALFVPVAAWMGICVGNAVPGFLVLLFARQAARAVLPVEGPIPAGGGGRTAIAVAVRNEDMSAVLAPLGTLLDELGAPELFTLFVLSDTADAAAGEREAAAVAAFGRGARYRRRTSNEGFKAGNVMEFLDHHAEGFEFCVILDADSTMSAEAVRRLVAIMRADPRMGLVQHLTAGRPAAAAFPRLFQFGMRHGMRVWSVGQALWQGRDGPFWGHNAIFRIAPFRAHCRLEKLSDGATILSHDQVEAARLATAGWGVAVWADDDGSYEANPPAMPEFLHRDGRWLAGNMQYAQLLRLPGFSRMGRWQLVQAMLLFATAPMYALLGALAPLLVAGAERANPAAIGLAVAWPLALYAPKLLGYLETLLIAPRRARYGGAGRLLAGAVAEITFSLLLDAAGYVSKCLALARVMLGLKAGWAPQNRSDRGIGWGEATRLYWPHTLAGLTLLAALWHASPIACLWLAPFTAGAALAIPFCVATASPGLSAWLRTHGLAAMPEELGLRRPGAPPLDPAGA